MHWVLNDRLAWKRPLKGLEATAKQRNSGTRDNLSGDPGPTESSPEFHPQDSQDLAG